MFIQRHIACEQLIIASVTTIHVETLYITLYYNMFRFLWPSPSKIFTLSTLLLFPPTLANVYNWGGHMFYLSALMSTHEPICKTLK
jgi:hypothetical protein